MHDECVLLGPDIDVVNYRSWFEKFGGDKSRVEVMMNHQHVADLFPNSDFVLTKEVAVSLGDVMSEMLKAKLSRDFPSLDFCVLWNGDILHDDIYAYEISFYRIRK